METITSHSSIKPQAILQTLTVDHGKNAVPPEITKLISNAMTYKSDTRDSINK